MKASREGKAVLVRELRYGDDGQGSLLIPRPGASSSTVVLSVEIKDETGAPSPSSYSLVDNQEKMIRALNAICSGQLTAGRQLTRIEDQGGEMGMGIRELNSGMDTVALGVSGTSSEVAGVTEIGMHTDRTLEKINGQLAALGRVVDDLASSMGEVAGKIDDLARADDFRDEEESDAARRSGSDNEEPDKSRSSGRDAGRGGADIDLDSGGEKPAQSAEATSGAGRQVKQKTMRNECSGAIRTGIRPASQEVKR